MVAHVFTVAPIGFEGALVDVESDIKRGLPAIQIVGLGTKSVEEAKERVRSAVTNSLLDFPSRKITINLAPAELVKDGAHYDLPIALSILISSGQLRQSEVDGSIYAGELSLDGRLRPIKGAINIAETAKKSGYKRIYVPVANASQACLIDGLEVYGIKDLKEIFLHLKEEKILQPAQETANKDVSKSVPYLDDVYGQEQAKRALVIAAAGRHNILLTGSPGAGKTMLAKTIVGLMPRLTIDERIAVTKLHSLAGEIDGEIVTERPFRSPHHTTSSVAIVGGGTRPKPGEISLAHLGILFMDEIPEYQRSVLESLRQPLEDKEISVSRASGRMVYPADFILIATMNPCPCGHLGDPRKECSCTNSQILSYQRRLSGPLLDRIDMVVNVSRVPNEILLDTNISSKKIQHIKALKELEQARKAQAIRYNHSSKYNGLLKSSEVLRHFHLSPKSKDLLNKAGERLGLSARSYFKVIKVARTIADLEDEKDINEKHIAEALQYRTSNS
jgi:magnesium chelatase family protein